MTPVKDEARADRSAFTRRRRGALARRHGVARLRAPRVAVAFALAALALAGCGGAEGGLDSLAGDVAKARDAQAFSSLQQALTAAAAVRAESGGSFGAAELAGLLQARNPSKRFGTGPSTGPDQIQVLGDGSALMLVVRSSPQAYLAAWDDGGTTLYYRGEQPPQFTAQQPAGPGWGATLPQ
jgi:hypothetical protein